MSSATAPVVADKRSVRPVGVPQRGGQIARRPRPVPHRAEARRSPPAPQGRDGSRPPARSSCDRRRSRSKTSASRSPRPCCSRTHRARPRRGTGCPPATHRRPARATTRPAIAGRYRRRHPRTAGVRDRPKPPGTRGCRSGRPSAGPRRSASPGSSRRPSPGSRTRRPRRSG